MTSSADAPIRVLGGVVVPDALFVAQLDAAGKAYRARPDNERVEGIVDTFAWVGDLCEYTPVSCQALEGSNARAKMEMLLATQLLQDGVISRQVCNSAMALGYYRQPLVPEGTTRARLEGTLITLVWMFAEDQPAPLPWPGVRHLPGIERRPAF